MDAPAIQRRSLRLRNYDYSQSGAYFVTLCVQNKICLLGDISEGILNLNTCGQLTRDAWLWLARQYAYVALDEFVVMPNHLHGILIIDSRRGGSRTAFQDAEGRSRTAPRKTKPLGSLIAAFKTVSAKSVNTQRFTPGAALWQRNYYEHVIRNETDLARIREYIQNNPAQWALDEENPDHPS